MKGRSGRTETYKPCCEARERQFSGRCHQKDAVHGGMLNLAPTQRESQTLRSAALGRLFTADDFGAVACSTPSGHN